MNQNSTVDNDLQKAIDDITNNTNADPVFSDPVAAPSSVPEGDDGSLAEAVGPFPAPQPIMPAPTTPFDSSSMPNLNAPMNFNPETADFAPAVTLERATEELAAAPVPETLPEPAPAVTTETHSLGSVRQVKEAALRDLIPLLDHLTMNPSQKFNLYRNIFEELKDYTVLEPAYRAAGEIADDQERAEALFYLVESIDKM